MTQVSKRSVRSRTKTWSSFGNLGRRPSEYEIVTHNMNHTYGGSAEPLEMGPNVNGNVWLREHRDQRLFGVSDWNQFRDPDELTYRKYCTLQDEQETYVDCLLRDFTDAKKSDAKLSTEALNFLQLTMTPCRYLGHGEQMLSAYIQQMAPSAYAGNCATFQTADALRRVQRVAYRTKQLANAYPGRGFGSSERRMWEQEPDWQPVRKAIELALVEYDFDRAFVKFQLVLRPILDNLFLNQFADVAHTLGAEADALISRNLYLDSQRANRWSNGLAQYVMNQNPKGRDELRLVLADERAQAGELIQVGARLLARYATSDTAEHFSIRDGKGWFGKGRHIENSVADAISARVFGEWTAFVDEVGLGSDA